MTSILGQGTGPIIEALDSTMKKMGMSTEGQARNADSECQCLQGLLHGPLHWILLTFAHGAMHCISNTAWYEHAPGN
jgi:hypothetical protein